MSFFFQYEKMMQNHTGTENYRKKAADQRCYTFYNVVDVKNGKAFQKGHASKTPTPCKTPRQFQTQFTRN